MWKIAAFSLLGAVAAGVVLASPVSDFGSSIERCWNVGSLRSDALKAQVILQFDVREDGGIDFASIALVSSDAMNESATEQAFQAARRAIIRCTAGVPLENDLKGQTVVVLFSKSAGIQAKIVSNFLVNT